MHALHSLWRRRGALAALPVIAAAVSVQAFRGETPDSKHTIGPVAQIVEASSGVTLTARVDTGATVSSLHCPPDAIEIKGASDVPAENVRKPVRIRVENRDGQAAWVETRIEDYVEVRCSEGSDYRYRVRLPLRCGRVQRQAIVNLNDRSHMTYRMLLGRDFLAGKFLVDVARGND
ncbi:MAG: RimK/LysX family protein [Planctomycetota bacterium]